MTQATLAAVLAATAATATAGFDRDARPDADELRWRGGDAAFNRIATFANYRNRPDLGEETVSEIVAASADGRTAIYTDGAQGAIGFVDISDPRNPAPAGTLALDGPVGGGSSLCAGAAECEPTAVAVHRGYALVGVSTSASFVSPSGHLAVVDIAARQIVAELPLGGQPDSVAVSPDGAFAAVAIENERDEEICVGGANDGQFVDEDDDAAIAACEAGGGVVGGLPQTPFGNPPGFLAVVDLAGMDPAGWRVRPVALTGLADFAPEDPEPEFVDINDRNEAVVSLQENNHIAIVDLAGGAITGDFPLGAVTLNGVDATEDGVISLTETLTDLPREPDAVAWVPVGRGQGRGAFVIGTANEGDLFGGSRGFSLFNPNGAVLFDSAAGFEELAVQHGHYPEERSENKGSEPESIEWARFGRDSYLFVGSERGSFVAIYRLRGTQPRFVQLLPAPLGPEGVLAVPSRNLLLVSGEEDDPPSACAPPS